jgi:hypothetical protein
MSLVVHVSHGYLQEAHLHVQALCSLFMTLPGQVENGSFIFIKISALILPSMKSREHNGMEVQRGPEIS